MEEFSLKGYQISELEKLLDACPWFSIARKELFLKMSAMGEEYRRDALRRTVLYLYPDYSVFRQGYVLSSAAVAEDVEQQVYELDLSGPVSGEESASASGIAGTAVDTPQVVVDAGATTYVDAPADVVSHREIYVVGGDYFMSEDLKSVQNQDLTSLEINHSPLREEDSSEFTDEAYYTETLARIYADQELYDRANEVYEKLILLYPEKSAYFAALKNDIKKHGNQTFGVRQTADFLEKATWTLAIIILALCILATAFTPSRRQADNAVLQRLEQTGTSTGAPEFPSALPGDEAAPVEPVETPAE